MTPALREYARIGLVHHLLYPESTADADHHEKTLATFSEREDIETFDCCLPFGDERRQRLIPRLRACGKVRLAYAAHLFPFRHLTLATTSASEQGLARLILADQIEQAAAIGATGFVFASGGPSPALATEANHQAFAEMCGWLCEQLAPHGITALLEPFDMDIDKCFLYGPTKVCADFVAAGAENFGIELDLAHVPLMRESFEQAIRNAAPQLCRVHLGNCVLQDTTHPRYGDTHPPIGLPGGEIDTPQLVEILGLLLDVGFLGTEERGDLVFEMTPWPGKSVDETVADTFTRLDLAWQQVWAARNQPEN
ncbi:MAG: sugar phosphate isomerase/epimerase [Victivallales bacterium]|nr:sugar phosphate isomerase/epimerase [Victivallales bacterium]